MKLLLQAARGLTWFIIIISWVVPAWAQAVHPLSIHASGREVKFSVEVAQTMEEKERGLMYRKELAADGGMLFPFASPQPVYMWMRHTLIPLDMVFIAPDGKILRIEESAAPESTRLIASGGAVIAVLELPGGTAARIGAKAGDSIVSGELAHAVAH